jgi:signal transduction histidine kinase
MLSAPLTGKEGPLGILRAYAIEPRRFTPEDESYLLTIAAQGSIAIENAMAFQAVAELDATKSNFIRIVTHELRSPVSVTQSLLRTLTAGYAGAITTPQKDILKRAARRVEFLQKLIDDLLDLAAGKTYIKDFVEMESVPVLICVERVVKRFELSAREKNLLFEMNQACPQRYPVVMATVEGLDRVLDNLISNAIKYTPREGRVTVTVICTDEEVQIAVEDTGIGIPEEALGHIFEEFYRATNAREIEHEGTGLGLTIVKDIVTRFGGRIAVNSQPGAGSRFTVILPLVLNEESDAEGLRDLGVLRGS